MPLMHHNKDYFEGILQIRGGSQEILDWIHERVAQDKRARISKQKKVPNGIDLYMTDQHYLQNLGHKLKEKYPGILKISRRLFTVDKMTSKLLYRVNVLFKPLGIKRGDIITVHGEQVEILRIEARVHVKELKSGKKKDIDLEAVLRAIR